MHDRCAVQLGKDVVASFGLSLSSHPCLLLSNRVADTTPCPPLPSPACPATASSDPKIRNSKFLQFVSKMSRGELIMEDNQVGGE